MRRAGYYRDFIPNFAAGAAPLPDLTRKGQSSEVEWGDAQEKAYQTNKILLTSDPSLVMYIRARSSALKEIGLM